MGDPESGLGIGEWKSIMCVINIPVYVFMSVHSHWCSQANARSVLSTPSNSAPVRLCTEFYWDLKWISHMNGRYLPYAVLSSHLVV